MTLKSYFFIVISLILMFGLGYLIAHLTLPDPDPIHIDLTDIEKQQVVAKARFGYISLDSAKSLISVESKINWEIRDSVDITYKDSLRIQDSIEVVYIPFYESKAEIITFEEKTEKYHITIDLKLKQYFFPLQKTFTSDLQLMHLKIDIPEPDTKPESGIKTWFSNFLKNRFIVYIGFGINYLTEVALGFQFGVGIRVL